VAYSSRLVLQFVASSIIITLGAGMAACRHRAPAVAPVAEREPASMGTAAPPPPPPPPPPAPAPTPPALTEDEIFRSKSLDQINAEAPLADALFDYDAASLRPDAMAALAGDARWLLRWPSTRITIEGHCDERGTAEYNLALGDRRAQAVLSYLRDLGVDAARMTAVSYGKERPVCRESAESCWQRNRRGHLVITAK
jgi:peptidoglycan-associated lipoprotein